MQRKYDAKSQQHPNQTGTQHSQAQPARRDNNARDSNNTNSSSNRNHLQTSTSHRTVHSLSYFKSPQEILAASGSGQAVRERNVANSLLDFFGM